MKKILAILGLMSLLGMVCAQAQVPTYAPQTLYTTNHATALNGSSANAPGVVIDCRKQAKVAVAITVQPKTTATSTVGFWFLSSVDGVSYNTVYEASKVILATPSGTAGTASTVYTNLDTQGCGYLKLAYYTNSDGTAGNAITNVSVVYGTKISAP